MNKQKKRTISTVIMLIFGLCILVGVYWLTNYWIKNKSHPTPPPKIEKITTVQTANLLPKNHPVQIKVSGFIKPKALIKLSSEVSGKVTLLSPKLEQGKSFNSGDTLLKIDPLTYQANLAQAKANLAQVETLYKTEVAKGKSAQFSNRQLGIKSTALSLRTPQIAAAKAQLKYAKTQIKLHQKNLDNTEIKASFNGIVLNRFINQGEIANTNQTLAEVVDTKLYTVEISISNKQFKFVSLGQTVLLTDPITQLTLKGKIDRISPVLSKTNRTATLFVDVDPKLDNNQILLLEGFLDVIIQGKAIENSVWIPNNTLINNEAIWYTSENSTLKKANVTVIYQSHRQALIQLKSKIASIVLNPSEDFYEGQSVVIHSSEESSHSLSKPINSSIDN